MLDFIEALGGSRKGRDVLRRDQLTPGEVRGMTVIGHLF